MNDKACKVMLLIARILTCTGLILGVGYQLWDFIRSAALHVPLQNPPEETVTRGLLIVGSFLTPSLVLVGVVAYRWGRINRS
jgi:hypothetical protein